MRARTLALLVPAALVVTSCAGAGAPRSSASPPGAASTAAGVAPVTLTIFAAGTLVNPFKEIDAAFMKKYPNVTVQAQFGGSVKEVKQITELGERADVVGVADYSVIPTYLMKKPKTYADWYIGFVSNSFTFVYTDKSKGAAEITPQNWYKILSEPGVRIGRANPNTDPSGYQTLLLLKLAESYYHQPGLYDAILRNSPPAYMRDTETELIGPLQSGDIDYLAIYRSDAIQHHFRYLKLPADIGLSDASKAAFYKSVSVHVKDRDIQGKPIVYALTIPADAPHSDWAVRWVEMALHDTGRQAFERAGFVVVSPALASSPSKVPATLRPLVEQWP